jgi:membrane protease YdiL (CAAX protease family)
MLLAFAFTRSPHIQDPIAVAVLAAFYPFTEEVMSRGFAFRLLYVRERWPWWMAAAIVALVTGAVHVEKSQSVLEVLGLFAYTGIGGGITCWLLARWGSLWFPFGVHMFGNLWWEVFSVSRTALGGWFAFAAQAAMILTAILITAKMTPPLADQRVPKTVKAKPGPDRKRTSLCWQRGISRWDSLV